MNKEFTKAVYAAAQRIERAVPSRFHPLLLAAVKAETGSAGNAKDAGAAEPGLIVAAAVLLLRRMRQADRAIGHGLALLIELSSEVRDGERDGQGGHGAAAKDAPSVRSTSEKRGDDARV